jgi:hypothetical protein
MISIGNFTLEQDSSSEDETWKFYLKNIVLVGSTILVLVAGLAIQRKLGVFLKNHDSRLINKMIQCHRVCNYATLRRTALLDATLRYSTLLYATLLYATLLYATLRYSTLLYATLRYSTLLYATLRCSRG